jgi:precorrin-6x reductase
MNEQIGKLISEAIKAIPDHVDFDLPKEFTEKFAELIVAECMKTCDETQAAYLKYRKESDDFQDKNIYAEGEAVCAIIKYKMKKQFGVE